MERLSIQPRNNWQKIVEQLGFGFHSTHAVYWDESACYTFSLGEIEDIENATASLWEMCLTAVQHVIDHQLYNMFQIPETIIPYLKRSWHEDAPSIYGRFDLCYKNGQIKMLEFNADTPTSLYEAGIVQWFWLQDYDKTKDQFNSIHEKLIAHWKFLSSYLHPGTLHFSCLKGSLEDLTNTEYLRDCAMQADIDSRHIFIDDIGWDDSRQMFADTDGLPIKNLFKLYPWEFLMEDPFAEKLAIDSNRCFFIEPPWKMILSNKAILPVLWKLFPGHPLLLPAYFEHAKLPSYVKKPMLSREGANIDIVSGNEIKYSTDGEYGESGFIYQELFELPCFEGNYPVIGSWVIGQQPAGIGIRESNTLVTDNLSRFIPHLICGE
jgi:glutathionylspermidine synthase